MAKILSIVSLPGTHAVPVDRMADIYKELHPDRERITKMKAFVREEKIC